MYKRALAALFLTANCFAVTLNDIQQRLNETQIIGGSFKQTKSIVGLAHPLNSHGEYYVDKLSGLVWQQQFPFSETLVVLDGKLYNFIDGQYSLNKAPEAMAKLVAQLLEGAIAGDWQTLAAYSAVSAIVGEELPEWGVNVIPNEAPLNHLFSKISIRGRDSCIHSIFLHEVSGNETLISMDCADISAELPALLAGVANE